MANKEAKQPLAFEKIESFRTIDVQGADLYYENVILNRDLKVKNSAFAFHRLFKNLMPQNLDIIFLNEKGKFKYKELKGEYYSEDFVDVCFDYTLKLDENNKQVFDKDDVKKDPISTTIIRKYLYLNGFDLNKHHYVRYKRASGSARNGHCLFIREELFNLLNKWSKTGLNESKDLCNDNLTSYEAYKALSLSSLIKTFKLNPYHILFVKDAKVILKNQKVIKVYEEDKLLDSNKKDKKKDDLEENTTKVLAAKESVEDIENNIFDGEGLLDKEVFKEQGYAHKGMMLLRNRFFKCCAFNTNLQKWFKDNGITKTSQLNGYTFTENIKDIKLVVSESCLKYLKMTKGGFNKKNIKRWCDNIVDSENQSIFGVVKTDKPTRFFHGQMVETTYQLLNTLELLHANTGALIAPYVEYINYIRDLKNTPYFIRYFLEGEAKEEDEEYYEDETEDLSDDELVDSLLDYSRYTFKNKICLDLLKIDKNVIKTNLFKYRVYNGIVDSLKLKLYNGRVLVNGTYSTLFGNPMEYLNYIILDKDNKPLFDANKPSSIFKEDELHSTFFANGTKIVGSRAPHSTMGNVLLAINAIKPEIVKYFNLTNTIVCVDAVNNNIQQRLSGSDYDSDTMLMTDNDVLVKTADKNYKKFLVPYASYKPADKVVIDENLSILERLDIIDRSIANNNVGAIVNLSQLLNSHLWNIHKKAKKETINELYQKICILSCLSGAEIDRSKRPFNFNTYSEYKAILKYATDHGYAGKDKKPLFFSNISNDESRSLTIGEIETVFETENYFKTAMDFLWKAIYEAKFLATRSEPIPFCSLINQDYTTKKFSSDIYRQIDEAIKALVKLDRSIFIRKKVKKKDKRKSFAVEKKNFYIEVRNCYDEIKKHVRNIEMARLLLNRLEKRDTGYSTTFLFLYIVSIFYSDLGYSLASFFPYTAKGLPGLEETSEKNKQYIIFNKYYLRVKEEDSKSPFDVLLSVIFS